MTPLHLAAEGTLDEVVPVESSVEYAQTRPNVQIITVPDDHGLATSLPVIEAQSIDFFGLA